MYDSAQCLGKWNVLDRTLALLLTAQTVNPESNINHLDEPSGREEAVNGKRIKRGVGDNTQFVVDGMRDTMRKLVMS
ncbi:hypothetical protein R1sor_017307 [Riccia sorocarpa]|uniref:Uncharacterized protein n=1 Tax=Riccia sorocarpa TaxID=122646 RepID=A0ABD3I6G1_9MARC